jgi:ribokinase
MEPVEFLAIGDVVVDEFIRLKEASVNCAIDGDACTISMRWGDKIPFESATLIAGVGNSGNAAVSAARLGLKTALIANVGEDRDGEDIVAALAKEKMDTSCIARHPGCATNHHFVLWYESERTILVKPERYPYAFPEDLPPVKTVYLSSIGDVDQGYYDAIAAFLESSPGIFLTFQPGTFQMKLGAERLKRIYARADLLVVNKEEAARILGSGAPEGIRARAEALKSLGPKTVIVTDGREGAFALHEGRFLMVPLYPDSRAPFERTGAGDAFASTVTAALTLGLPFEEALLWGPINSMAVVQELGAQRGLLTKEALLTFRRNAPSEYEVREA